MFCQIFRSGHLANASENDKALFQNMGIQIICDFRSQGEKDAQPNWLPEDGSTTYLQYPIVHGEFDPVAAMESLQKGDISWLTEDFIIKRYIAKIDLFPKLQLAVYPSQKLSLTCFAVMNWFRS